MKFQYKFCTFHSYKCIWKSLCKISAILSRPQCLNIKLTVQLPYLPQAPVWAFLLNPELHFSHVPSVAQVAQLATSHSAQKQCKFLSYTCNSDGLVQEWRNSSALEMELRLSCTHPSISITTSQDIVYQIWQCKVLGTIMISMKLLKAYRIFRESCIWF